MPDPTSPPKPASDHAHRPRVGITADIFTIDALERRVTIAHYARAVAQAGGLPLALDPNPDLAHDYARALDAFVLTGGDDPVMETWNTPTHPAAKPVHPDRQAFELALLDALNLAPKPTLGVCLGMQYMALHAGGAIDQHLPDSTPTHADHWDQPHTITGDYAGTVHSKHRQAITDPGSLRVAARAHDHTIEAIANPDHPFYLGVQWHPERTADHAVGQRIFEQLVHAAASA